MAENIESQSLKEMFAYMEDFFELKEANKLFAIGTI